METEKAFWQLHEFASILGKHYTTINDWFNKLESKRIHFISRAENGDRVYDAMDLKIAEFILQKRTEDWGLTAIFNVLSEQDGLELRDVPNSHITDDDKKPVTLDQLKAVFQSEMTEYLTNTLKTTIQQSLPQLIDPQQQRLERVNEMLTQHKIQSKLRIDALEEWSKLSKDDTTKRVGLFKREEDISKRDLFIERYISEKYESTLKKNFGIEE
jgi:DNA-binding transcriptional MerR regulator